MNRLSGLQYYKEFVAEQVTQVIRKESCIQLSLKIYYGKALNLRNSINEEIDFLIQELPYEKKVFDLNFMEVIKEIPVDENVLFLSQKGKIDSLHENPLFLEFEKNICDVQEKILEIIETELSKKIKLVD